MDIADVMLLFKWKHIGYLVTVISFIRLSTK